MTLSRRTLGRSGIEVSALGLGCWAIGGPFQRDGEPLGWGAVDDRESIRAIHEALDLGINLFDTADMYGCGHSETILGKAIRGRRADVVVATKFGNRIDAQSRIVTGRIQLPADIGNALENSLRRLQTDCIDVYQLHIGDCAASVAREVQGRLEEFVTAGKIRCYGWSSDLADRVGVFDDSPAFAVFQQALNVLQGNRQTLHASRARGLATLCRSPLAMGILAAKSRERGTAPDDDLRSRWRSGSRVVAEMQSAAREIREVLQQGGRSPAQGALAWLLTLADSTIPIPGFRTAAQVQENAAVLQQGPLSRDQMDTLELLVQRNFPDNPTKLRHAD